MAMGMINTDIRLRYWSTLFSSVLFSMRETSLVAPVTENVLDLRLPMERLPRELRVLRDEARVWTLRVLL